MFRVYGAHTETYINRTDEIETMQKMARLGLGSKFYGRFKNGICYEYLPGSTVKSFVYEENVFSQIAKAIARFRMFT
jgi:ethanolamine kinase